MAYTLAQIAHIETDFSEKFGIPRQSGLVEELRARIVFEPEFRSPDAVRGLDGYDYIWLVWQFSTVVQAGQDGTNWRPTVRPPRLGGNTRMGVFATRSPFRPNALGLSSVKLLKVEPNTPQGPVLTVGGADLLDGTPIFDIKPYLPYVDAHPDARGGFTDTTKFYTLQVQAEPEVLEQIRRGIDQFVIDGVLDSGIIEHPHRLLAVRTSEGVEKFHNIIKCDACTCGRSAVFRTACCIKNAGRFSLAVTNEESLFFLCPNTACKLLCDVGWQIKYRIVKEFFRDLDRCSKLICRKRCLSERIIRKRILLFLVHPDSLALGSHNRNLAVTVGSFDNGCHLAENALFLQRFHQFSFKLIRNKIAALCICTNVQIIMDIDPVTISDAVPESLLVGIACRACLFRYIRSCRLTENRC